MNNINTLRVQGLQARSVIFAMVISIVSSGCVTSPVKEEAPPVATPDKTVLIDRSLLESCDKPTPLTSREESVFTAWASDLLYKYRKCYEKNEAHIKLLKNNFPQVKPNS